MNTFSFGVSVFLEDEHHPGLTENKYKYVIAEEAEIKIMRKQEMRFRLIQRPQFFMLSVNMHDQQLTGCWWSEKTF